MNCTSRDIEKLRRQGESQTRLLNEILSNQHKQQQMLELLLSKMSEIQDNATQVPGVPVAISHPDIDEETVPSDYAIDSDVLREMARESSSAGNFAAHLMQKLFPELFGVANLRFQYNWYGGGVLKKKELCRACKNVIRQYVQFFYPEVGDETVFRDTVVPKLNEILRRVSRDDRKKQKQSETQDSSEETGNMSFTQLLNYVNL